MKNKILLKISIILVVFNLMSCGKEKSNNVTKIENETQVAEVINDLSLIGMDLGQFQEKYALSAIKVEDKKINYLIKIKNDRECNIVVDTADRKIVSVDSPDCFIPKRDSLKGVSNDYASLVTDITQKNIRLPYVESKYNLWGRVENQNERLYGLGDCRFKVNYDIPTKVVKQITQYRNEKCKFSLNFLGLQFESPNMSFGEFIRLQSMPGVAEVVKEIKVSDRYWGPMERWMIGVDNPILINVKLSRRHNNVDKECSLIFEMDYDEEEGFLNSDGQILKTIDFTPELVIDLWNEQIPKNIKFSYCDDDLAH